LLTSVLFFLNQRRTHFYEREGGGKETVVQSCMDGVEN